MQRRQCCLRHHAFVLTRFVSSYRQGWDLGDG